MLHNKKRAIALTATVLLAVAGCSSQGGAQEEGGGGGGNGGGNGESFTIVMITHEAPGAAFWDRVRSGAEQAAENLGVNLQISNDIEAPGQATLVQNAIDTQPDGIAVTLAFPEAVGPAAASAAEAGIPVVALNAGMDTYQQYGVSMFFGSNERLAGETAGETIAQDGADKAICAVHEQGNVALETRCDGVKDAFPNTENVQVDGTDRPSAQATIGAKLQQDPAITHIITLDAGIADAAVQARADTGSQAKVATFDLSPEVVTAIQNGDIAFSVDQQPYLQGYLAVEALWLNLTNGNEIGGGQPVLTGPAIVDSSNIDTVAQYAERGTR